MKKYTLFFLFIFFVGLLHAQTINYSYDDLGRLTQVVYPDSSTIKYTYDASGNRFGTKVVNLHYKKVPVITSFNPKEGKQGTIVTITGLNFDNASAVNFGGVLAGSYHQVSSTSITAVVGTGFSGAVAVTTPGGTASLSGFNFIFDLPPTNFKITITGATCKDNTDGMINVTASQNLNYSATITGDGVNSSYPFTNTLDIKNLAAGTYSLCFTVEGQPDFQQCSAIVITEPKDLSVFSAVSSNQLTLFLNGGNSYNIMVNNKVYTTIDNSITVSLETGNNSVEVTTDRLCQGIYNQLINGSSNIVPYPNPFRDILNLNIGNQLISNVSVEMHDISNGRLVYSGKFVNTSGVLQLDMTNIRDGVFALHLSMDGTQKIFKIMKK